ncbi:ArsR/SmtB family transcription factor [Fulvivirga sediminis]|uniref:Metalloregulator ArsR/SmtB family transcription factor n=1 Tax=Fulvivirga sediminis TaxID=2803949 RepID=A0A937F2H7_9BACT|nr:metalloregulator ArsR/SmtB family transcription factor [Fulvivirga sediminis]MBL3655097.1 metalloregulator ArsR/SmtB family transcription factor [Fulvivirga sediminis]
MRLKNFSLSFGSQIFKSCSDESRLRILFLIFQNKEMCISDLEQILDFTQTKTSRHLIYLKNSGIVSTRKHDQWVFYHLKDEVYDIISQIFQFLEKDQTLKIDLQTYKTMYSNRELALNKLETKNWQRE